MDSKESYRILRTKAKPNLHFSEKNLGKVFKTELEREKFYVIDAENQERYYTSFRVYLNKPVPTHSDRFRHFWEEEGLDPTNIPPSQPEIDMILEDDKGDMRAVELKVVRKRKRGIRPSYYLGIGQTLAYLSFGFPQVALWLCFDGDSMEDREIYEYNDAFMKIIFPLKSYVDTTFFRILNLRETLKIQSRLWVGKENRWVDGIGIPMNGTHRMTWNSNNLFLRGFQTSQGHMQFDPAISNRPKAIYRFLEGQKRKYWKR